MPHFSLDGGLVAKGLWGLQKGFDVRKGGETILNVLFLLNSAEMEWVALSK